IFLPAFQTNLKGFRQRIAAKPAVMDFFGDHKFYNNKYIRIYTFGIMETGITIFTPTYNRAHLLNRLFESIKNLSYENFEWLIVDDGSTDETEKLINRFREKSKFKIIYVKQENQGKYMAINNGVKLANKELFFIVDSDDWLPNDSLNRIDEYYKKIKSNEGFAGVAGLKKVMNKNAESISLHENEFITNSLDFRFTYNYSGDVAEVYRTSVLKDYPFP